MVCIMRKIWKNVYWMLAGILFQIVGAQLVYGCSVLPPAERFEYNPQYYTKFNAYVPAVHLEAIDLFEERIVGSHCHLPSVLHMRFTLPKGYKPGTGGIGIFLLVERKSKAHLLIPRHAIKLKSEKGFWKASIFSPFFNPGKLRLRVVSVMPDYVIGDPGPVYLLKYDGFRVDLEVEE